MFNPLELIGFILSNLEDNKITNWICNALFDTMMIIFTSGLWIFVILYRNKRRKNRRRA